MRIRQTSEAVRSHLLEYTAAKTGLLLTDEQLFSCLHLSGQISPYVDLLQQDTPIITRVDFLEAAVLLLRAQLGELPDPLPDAYYANEILLNLHPTATEKEQTRLMECARYWNMTPGAPSTVKDILNHTGLSVSLVEEIFRSWDKIRDRSYDLRADVEESEWDTHEPLTNLFDSEHVPENADHYLDQRFIDYLAAQESDLKRVHWRNFERLCSEFFARHNRRVELSRMGGDGGIDIRVYSEKDETGKPPLIVIQCKRLGDGEYVEMATVKALYEDARWEGADGCLFVTTGIIGATNERMARARKYKIARAEHVSQWVRSMWRHHQTFTPKVVRPYPAYIPLLQKFVDDEDAMRTFAHENAMGLMRFHQIGSVHTNDLFIAEGVRRTPGASSGQTHDLKPQGPIKKKIKKVGRNAPCPCGSGKKYKKCCLK